ncbi:MAG: phosphatidylcholine/phosphatidylserine synthase [Rickettsiaceae bacterium]|nr:phosphatidylcholine/phosphatidylserine synthase [Rickettsiaceae bacterium]
MQPDEQRLKKTSKRKILTAKSKKKKTTKPVPFAKMIPSLVTLTGLVIGLSSVRFALDSAWQNAVYCIIAATILDGLDGGIARKLKATSHFGLELDSLCDLVNFGFAPVLITYLWSFQQHEYKVISWAAIMLFVVCMSVRLARFNISAINKEKEDKNNKFLLGIPAPAGALLVLVPMMLDFKLTALWEFDVRSQAFFINLYIIFIGLLLASRLPTISKKNFYIKPEYLSLAIIGVTIIIIITIIYPWYALPAIALIYMLSIPVTTYLANKPEQANNSFKK